MRSLTITLAMVVMAMCATGPTSASAEEATHGGVVVTEASLPAMALPAPIELPEMVAPPDILNFVEEQYVSDLVAEVNAAAAKHPTVPVELGWEVIRQESGFHHLRPNGTIKRGGSGEVGICQILIDGMAIKKCYNVWDRAENIECMFALLEYALDRGYSLERALGWYNSGSPIINQYARTVSKAYRSWVKNEGGTPL